MATLVALRGNMSCMAGRPLKPPEQRRRYNQPSRGEWIDLPERLDEPVLREWDDRFTISPGLWAAWRRDAVGSQYTDADIGGLEHLAVTWEERSFADRDRQMDKFGLTPKGRRDLRWRTPLEASQQADANAKTAQIRRLRVVARQQEKKQEET